ncbi:sugar transferase [Terrisporobacter sp.]
MDLKLNSKFNNRMYFIIKRFFDCILSLVGIIILIPVFMVTAIAIKIDSRGPIIFKQKRYGKNKTPFYIYKFRTMSLEAPKNVSTNEFSNSKQYITKTGNILRRTSIDELPQLFNVLVGEMSLIGPRPVILKEKNLIIAREKYGANDIKPGLTGWAQVNGRDKLSVEEKAKLDGYYVENMSIFMDLKCIFKTIKYVLKGEGIVEGEDSINISHI